MNASAKLLLLLILGSRSLQSQEMYTIGGTVINAATNAPYPMAHVSIARTGTNRAMASMITGNDGRFSMRLPAGKYHLYAGSRDSLQIYGKPRPDASVGSALFVNAKSDTSSLVFLWYPPVAISGKITDNNSEPVQGALIQLVRANTTAGRRVMTTAAWAYTNDLGEYRFGSIAAGTFYLTANGEPWYEKPGFPNVPDQKNHVSYRTVHYPNVNDASHAAPIVLKPGTEAHADFTFTEAIGAAVTVKYDAPPAFRGSVSLIAEGIGGTDAFQRTSGVFRGEQILPSVPPGHYTVRVSGSGGNTSMAGRQELDVSGPEAAVEVKVRPFSTVSGRVQFPTSSPRPAGSLLVSLVREPGPGSIGTAIHPDGTFAFPAAAAGKWRVTLRAPGFFASEVRVEGAESRDGVVSLEDGGNVTISVVASDEMGELKGLLTKGGKPVISAMVVLAPANDGDRNPYRGFQTDSDGSFDFENLRTGDYLLFTAPDADIEYTNPAVVRPLLKDAKHVTVTKKNTTVSDISLQ